jgi:CRISPR-associated protein Cas5d
MNPINQVSLKIWGDYACFSRAEFKVERVSYPLITPSAARGVLEAVFWKPEFRYQIREIGVLKLGSQITILRNELSDVQGRNPIRIEDKRQQRFSLVLKDVEYLIRAEIVLRPHVENSAIHKYHDQFQRAAGRGQCHHTPYLGTREFAAWFALPDGDEQVHPVDMDLGSMLFDIAFVEDPHRKELQFMKRDGDGSTVAWGYAWPLFFNARLERGRMTVPKDKYAELCVLEEKGGESSAPRAGGDGQEARG